MCVSFPFGIEAGVWDLTVLIPDHCLSVYFVELASRKHHLKFQGNWLKALGKEDFVRFSSYGQGSHLGHVTKNNYINFSSHPLP